jgi:hypothetical protein
MKYSELLELYKQGKLKDEDRSQVQADIEKHEAISQYLFEEEVPGFEEFTITNDNGMEEEQSLQDVKFAKMIHKSIRKAFIKLGVVVTGIVLTVVLFVWFVLPSMVGAFFYNPEKIVKGTTKQFDLDMAVYTELFVPEQKREQTIVENNGYGNYDIRIPQLSSYDSRFMEVSGKIEQGKLTFYNSNIIKPFTGNAFVRTAYFLDDLSTPLTELIDEESGVAYSAAGSKKTAKEKIEKLNENTYYHAYVTLEKAMEYGEFVDFIELYDFDSVWCAPIVSECFDTFNNVGFFYNQESGKVLEWDEKLYPTLQLWNMESDAMKNNMNATQHFTDMLSYMIEQKEFCKMLGVDTTELMEQKEYVKNNGLYIHGFMITDLKENILEIFEEEQVYTIYTTKIS